MTKKLVLTGLLAALTCVATMVIQVPTPMNGYVNLGDCIVLLSAWILGPLWGSAAAGVGSMLADLLSGYAHYAPGTLVIKAAMALAAAVLFRIVSVGTPSPRRLLWARLTGAVCAEILMALGYLGYAWVLLGNGVSAATSIPGNLIQGIFGVVVSLALVQVLQKTRVLSRLSS